MRGVGPHPGATFICPCNIHICSELSQAPDSGQPARRLAPTACPWPALVSAFCIFSQETVLSPYLPTLLTPTIWHQHSPWLPEERCAAEGRARPGGALCAFCWGSPIPASSLAFLPRPGASPGSHGLQDNLARPAVACSWPRLLTWRHLPTVPRSQSKPVRKPRWEINQFLPAHRLDNQQLS